MQNNIGCIHFVVYHCKFLFAVSLIQMTPAALNNYWLNFFLHLLRWRHPAKAYAICNQIRVYGLNKILASALSSAF